MNKLFDVRVGISLKCFFVKADSPVFFIALPLISLNFRVNEKV